MFTNYSSSWILNIFVTLNVLTNLDRRPVFVSLPVNSSYPSPIFRSTMLKITGLSFVLVSSVKRVEKATGTSTKINTREIIKLIFSCRVGLSKNLRKRF